MEHLSKILNTRTTVPDGTKDLPKSGSASRGVGISLDGLQFKYPNGRHVLKGVSLEIEPGQSVAFVGPSGSGKSTLLRLILRTYDTSDGFVQLNSTPVKELKQASVREVTAVVPQDTVLFNGSIFDNIQYGKPGASREAVVAAAEAAQLHAAIQRMPAGYDTVVGERGLKLSGGEKQRVAIARAFLRNPELLVCDEATSALDSGTERGIMASLRELSRGRTSLFVAHRLSTVRHCDRIFVMEKGVVVEEGSHDTLMEKGGLYSRMWAMQQWDRDADKKKGADGDGSGSESGSGNGGGAVAAGALN